MARLIVKLHGEEIANLVLEAGREYTAGRSEDCAIFLSGQKGISRQHLKVYQEGDSWRVSLLSKFGALVLGGKKLDTVILKDSMVFGVPPFEFHFKAADAADETDDKGSEATKAGSEASANVNLPSVIKPNPLMDQNTLGNINATVAGLGGLKAYLKISAHGRDHVLRLEGNLWTAGRESTCEIPIEDSKASRRHFEILHSLEGYFVTDLESANGTFLNEERLDPKQPYQLTSGDVIRVSGVTFHFELRDSLFKDRLANLPAIMGPSGYAPSEPVMPSPYGAPVPYIPPPPTRAGARVVRMGRAITTKFKFDRNNKTHWAIAVLIPIIIYGLFFQNSPSTKMPEDSKDQASTSVTFEQLSPEQKQAAKDSFNLAKTLYLQGKYELCLGELKKLHEIVPAYDNSKEFESFCAHGVDLVLRERDKERKEQEQAEANRLIAAVVDDCKQQLKPETTLEDMRLCLASAIERDPEHPLIKELEQILVDREEQKRAQAESVEAQKQRKQAGQRHFENAKRLYQSGELAKALEEYEKFLNGGFPALEAEKTQAKRDLAQVRKELTQKVAGLIKSCKDNLEKASYKAAYIGCSTALKEDPTNGEAKRLKSIAVSEMRRELKNMYEDSVLEESMGNIDTAKEKWKQIMEKAVPGEEYFNKARRNLQKYGVGS